MLSKYVSLCHVSCLSTENNDKLACVPGLKKASCDGPQTTAFPHPCSLFPGDFVFMAFTKHKGIKNFIGFLL